MFKDFVLYHKLLAICFFQRYKVEIVEYFLQINVAKYFAELVDISVLPECNDTSSCVTVFCLL